MALTGTAGICGDDDELPGILRQASATEAIHTLRGVGYELR
jgi:hypothetical protein